MKWFKHFTGSHDDPDISDAMDELGDFGYSGFFILLEIYAEEFNHRDSEDFITISRTFLRRKLRKSSTKVEELLNFYLKSQRIISVLNNGNISYKVPKFIELADNWSSRKLYSNSIVTPPIEEEEEEENRIEIKKPPIPPKKKTDFEPESFKRFYAEYPKKVSRADALKAWRKIKPDTELSETIVQAVKNQIQWREEAERIGAFYPLWKNPSTWLNGNCWQDENCAEREIRSNSGTSQPPHKIPLTRFPSDPPKEGVL